MLRSLLFVGLVIQCALLQGQGRGDIRFLWYNAENYFDPFNDSLTEDDEFLPGSLRHWTWDRFERKTDMISKVIVASGGWKPPEIVALAEIENDLILHRLCRDSPLLKYNYHWIHKDSPDHRGIDIGLMYLPDVFRVLNYSFHRVWAEGRSDSRGIPEGNSSLGTRDILYIRGLVYNTDTLHLMLNHWPSRWEGKLETEERRMQAAGICRDLLDSVLSAARNPFVILAGDFNDEIFDPSISQVLRASACSDREGKFSDTALYALIPSGDRQPGGSLKYRGRWFLFDRIFTSGRLLHNGSGSSFSEAMSVYCDGMHIFSPDFLLERDLPWTGVKPFRTWNGYRYNGGFSDHLPVYVDIYLRKME